MIQNDFNFYIEKNKLIQEIEELKNYLEGENSYDEGILDALGISSFFKNFRIQTYIERFKSTVIKNLTNWFFRKNPEAIVRNINAEYERFLVDLEKRNLNPKVKMAVIEYTEKFLDYYINRVILKEKNLSPPENLQSIDVEEIENIAKDKKSTEIDISKEEQDRIKAELDKTKFDIENSLKDLSSLVPNLGQTNSDLPKDIDALINRSLRGQTPGNPRELIKQLIDLSKDPKVKATGNTVRGIINILNGIILMTRKAANSDDLKATSKLIKDLRTRLTKQNAALSATNTLNQMGANPPTK